jgi:hypothetical protein
MQDPARMAAWRLRRWAGPTAALGGVLWAAQAVIVASLPEGCVATDCDLPGRSMRDSSAAAPLSIVAAGLIALGVVDLVGRARHVGRFGMLGRFGVRAIAAGAALLVTGGLVQALFFGGDFPYMPLLVIPAGLALVIGFLLLGVAVRRARVLPRWAGTLLIVGTLAMLGFNDQDGRALLAVPFGVAWVATGYALWSGRGGQPVER